MKQFLLMACTIAFIMLVSCNSGSPKQAMQEYYYYPSNNIYYNVNTRHYLYSIDGGQTWDSIDARDYPQPEGLGEKQVVYATDSIWTNNAEHRRFFNGQLLTIVDEDSAAPEQAEVTDKVVPVSKPAAEKNIEQPKQKKFVGRLLQKIFGKKKDKQ